MTFELEVFSGINFNLIKIAFGIVKMTGYIFGIFRIVFLTGEYYQHLAKIKHQRAVTQGNSQPLLISFLLEKETDSDNHQSCC